MCMKLFYDFSRAVVNRIKPSETSGIVNNFTDLLVSVQRLKNAAKTDFWTTVYFTVRTRRTIIIIVSGMQSRMSVDDKG